MLGAKVNNLGGQLRARSVDLLALRVALLFDLTLGRDLGGLVAVDGLLGGELLHLHAEGAGDGPALGGLHRARAADDPAQDAGAEAASPRELGERQVPLAAELADADAEGGIGGRTLAGHRGVLHVGVRISVAAH